MLIGQLSDHLVLLLYKQGQTECRSSAEILKFNAVTSVAYQLLFPLFCVTIFAGSLESANSSILAARRLFKDLVGKNQDFMIIRCPIR